MIKRGQVFVRAIDSTGRYGSADVLDLDEESFRAFVVAKMIACRIVLAIEDSTIPGDKLLLRTKPGVVL